MMSKKQILAVERAGGVISYPTLNVHQLQELDVPQELREAMIAFKLAQRRINELLVQYEEDVKNEKD